MFLTTAKLGSLGAIEGRSGSNEKGVRNRINGAAACNYYI